MSLSSRRKDFKKGISVDKARSSRFDTTNQLRKKKKDAILTKRRRFVASSLIPKVEKDVTSPSEDYISELPALAAQISGYSANPGDALVALQRLRSITCQDNFPVEAIVGSPLLTLCATLVMTAGIDYVSVYEAIWILSNIASTEHTSKIADQPGLLDYLATTLIKIPDANIRYQTVWLLANITGESPLYRLHLATLEPFGSLLGAYAATLKTEDPSDSSANLAWLLYNMADGSHRHIIRGPVLEEWLQRYLFPILEILLFDGDKLVPMLPDTMRYAVWAYQCMTCGADERIESAIGRSKLLSVVCVILSKGIPEVGSADHLIFVPAFRCFSNICTGTSRHTGIIVRQRVVELSFEILRRGISERMSYDASFLLSNIAADQEHYVTVGYPHLVKEVIETFWESPSCSKVSIKVNFLYYLFALCDQDSNPGYSESVVYALVEHSTFLKRVILKSLRASSVEANEKAFDLISLILKTMPEAAEKMEEVGIKDVIDELLLGDTSEPFTTRLSHLLDTYWGEEPDLPDAFGLLSTPMSNPFTDLFPSPGK